MQLPVELHRSIRLTRHMAIQILDVSTRTIRDLQFQVHHMYIHVYVVASFNVLHVWCPCYVGTCLEDLPVKVSSKEEGPETKQCVHLLRLTHTNTLTV